MGRRQRGLWQRSHVRSGYELRIRENLESENRINFKYEDRKYKYIKQRCKHCGEVIASGTYTPDFNFYSRDTGEYLFTIEAKGRFTAADRKKLLAVREANPTIDLRLLFQRDQTICKGSKTRYSEWSEKHNFDFDFGEDLPIRWYKELTSSERS